MKIIGLAGWSGSGKTTLLTRVVPELKRRGVSVSTLKHAHHKFDIDTPGKDSYEHRAAGAQEVLVASANRWALMHELRGAAEWTLPQLLTKLSPVDLVIVEGFKTGAHPKLEVHRKANDKPLIYPGDSAIRAIACDIVIENAPLPVVSIDNIEDIATQLMRHAMDIGELSAMEGAH